MNLNVRTLNVRDAEDVPLRYNGCMDGPTTPEEHQAEIERLYRQAFDEFGAIALWNMHRLEHPTPGDALAITKALRTHGTMDGRRLAERIEDLCRAA